MFFVCHACFMQCAQRGYVSYNAPSCFLRAFIKKPDALLPRGVLDKHGLFRQSVSALALCAKLHDLPDLDFFVLRHCRKRSAEHSSSKNAWFRVLCIHTNRVHISNRPFVGHTPRELPHIPYATSRLNAYLVQSALLVYHRLWQIARACGLFQRKSFTSIPSDFYAT